MRRHAALALAVALLSTGALAQEATITPGPGAFLAVPVTVAKGGTNCTTATITCFNNITGFTTSGTTGTTSTNLVFSTAPSFVTPVLDVATGTSLALGGATIGSNALAVTGTINVSSTATFQSTVTAGSIFAGGSNQLGFSGRSFFSSPSNGTIILGGADVSSGAVAQTFKFQGNTASTTNGPLALIQGAGGGSSTSVGGELRLQGGLTQAAGTGGAVTIYTSPAAAGAAPALVATFAADKTTTLASALVLTSPGNDTGLTDASVCRVVSTGAVVTGTGTIGICLGTSSARYKHDIAPLGDGLASLLTLSPVSYRLNKDHGDPTKLYYGFTAEDMVKSIPALVGMDAKGLPNTADYLGLVPVLVKAVQELQAEVDELRTQRGLVALK